MASAPSYAATPRHTVGQASAANTNRDGTGTIPTIFTAGSNGSRIDKITINATGTTTAGVVRLFIHDGTNARLWREVLVPAITPGTATATFNSVLVAPVSNQPLLVLPNGYSLRASTHNAETFNVFAEGGDF